MAENATQTKDFAVIEAGGKQHLVSVGDVLEVELVSDLNEGDTVEFDKVLMTDDGSVSKIGAPYLDGKKVKATLVKQTKGEKLTIIRYKAKSNRDRRVGHRQKYSQVKIEQI